MQIESRKLPKNLIEVRVELTNEELLTFEEKALKNLAKEIKIEGFRPGKAPLEILKQRIPTAKIMEETAHLAINEKYPEIIKKENLQPVAPPQVEIIKMAPENPLIFKLKIPLMPKIKLGDYQNIKVEKKETKIEEKQVEKVITELQAMRGQEKTVLRKAKIGDKAKVDLELFHDKILLDNGQIKDMELILGDSKEYFPGLSKQILGMKKGENTEFSNSYPSSHPDKKVAGKKIDFKVKVKEIYQIDLPEINDEFAQNVGPFKNLEELKKQIKKNLEENAAIKENQRQEIEIIQKLIAQTEFEEIPESLVQHEAEKMVAELKASIEQSSGNFEDYLQSIKSDVETLREKFIPKAEERVKSALCIREIAKKENIKISPEEMATEMEKISDLYKNQEELLKNLKTESGQNYLRNLLTNRKVLDILKK
jgi:trigger factor